MVATVRREVRLAGNGGQGLILAGIILSEAAGLFDGLHVVQTQVYGPESRGGASRADVIISSEEIDYPKATAPDAMLVMSQDAYRKFGHSLAAGGLLIYDEDLVQAARAAPGTGQQLLPFPFTQKARAELRKPIVATIIGLGALAALTGAVSTAALEQAVQLRAPKGTAELNLRAVRLGFALAAAARPGVAGRGGHGP